jgi:hypothetical protein
MNAKLACKIMLMILASVLIYHLLIIAGVINYKNVWGGRLSNKNEMYVFETISILINAYLLLIILQKASLIKQIFSQKVQTTSLWIFIFVFLLNTIGNLFANNLYEKIAGTFFTFTSAYLCWTIVKQK